MAGRRGSVGTNKNGGTAIVSPSPTTRTLVINETDTVGQNADLGAAAITGTGGFTRAGTGTTQFGSRTQYSGTRPENAAPLRCRIGKLTNNSGKISKNRGMADNPILAFDNTGASVRGTAFGAARHHGNGFRRPTGRQHHHHHVQRVRTAYQGTTTVNGGTLQLANPTGAALSATSPVNISTTGTLLPGASNQLNATTPAPVRLHGAAERETRPPLPGTRAARRPAASACVTLACGFCQRTSSISAARRASSPSPV